ncbi:RecX family transcriptional regulator [Paenibacillus sp. KS-LC4]|uniref:RecX family transcriptional regulator n=1 Tax=Paenibacillus sp. KS-LC4 TaxID=2979727 RepID=UPI0030D08768
MIEIRAVEKDSKHRSRYLIFAGGEEPILSVHEDLLIRHTLFKGQLLTESQIEEIRSEDERYRAYAMAVYYLGFKPRTGKQIEQYLQRKLIAQDHINYTIERLEKEHIVDDEQYAMQFAAQRMKSSHKGRRYIQQELMQRGVSKTAALAATSAIDSEMELNAAISKATKKWRTIKGEPFERRRKLAAFLIRRGFPVDIIKAAVKSAEENA